MKMEINAVWRTFEMDDPENVWYMVFTDEGKEDYHYTAPADVMAFISHAEAVPFLPNVIIYKKP